MGKVYCALNVVLLLACLLMATIVVSTACRIRASAQVSGEAGELVASTGPPRPTDDQPLFLADTKNQQLMVYEYQPQTDQFSLTAVRRIQFDTFLHYFNTGQKPLGPSPAELQRMIQQQDK